MLIFELAYANKTGKWTDPKALRKIKCNKVLDQKICDFIGRMYTTDFATIWGTTKMTRDYLKKHPWFADIDWNWINDYAKGNLSIETSDDQMDVDEDPYDYADGQQMTDQYTYQYDQYDYGYVQDSGAYGYY